MIETIQVHELGSPMEDGRTAINVPITANVLTKNTVRLRRNFAGVKNRRRDIIAVSGGEKLKVNAIFGEYIERINPIELGNATIAPSYEPPKLSYTDRDGTLYRLCGLVPNNNGGYLGQYEPVFDFPEIPNNPPKQTISQRLKGWFL